MYNHLQLAEAIRVGRLIDSPAYDRVSLVQDAAQLAARLASDAEAVLESAAKFVDAAESGADDETLDAFAGVLGRDAATATATAYHVAAALRIANFDETVQLVLPSPLSRMS